MTQIDLILPTAQQRWQITSRSSSLWTRSNRQTFLHFWKLKLFYFRSIVNPCFLKSLLILMPRFMILHFNVHSMPVILRDTPGLPFQFSSSPSILSIGLFWSVFQRWRFRNIIEKFLYLFSQVEVEDLVPLHNKSS